jgi:3-hydroxyacyl-CoA dehydrogenase
MGRGIAQVSASAGVKVTMYDVRKEFLTRGLDAIASSAQRLASKKFPGNEAGCKKHVDEIVGNISLTTDLSFAAGDSDLVVEAVIENVGIKQEIFQRLDGTIILFNLIH